MRPIPPDEIRPVLATEPKWSDTGVDLELEQRIVKIDEDGGRLRAVLDVCDGLRTVSELGDEFGADARDLVRQLLATGGLVDVDQLWRRFHRLSGNPPPISRQISEDEVDELMRETFAPAEPIGDAIALAPLDSHVGAAARRRRSSSPEEQTNALGWEQLGALLSVAYGRAGDRWFTVPSGGALYPLVAHVLVRKPIGPLDPGVWWYDHWRGELRPQQLGRPDVEPMLIPHPVTDRLIAREEPIIAISADLRRTCRKYGARGYRFALMETGAVMQTAYLVGAELDIPVRACGGYYDGSVNALLGHPEGVVCTLMLFAGA